MHFPYARACFDAVTGRSEGRRRRQLRHPRGRRPGALSEKAGCGQVHTADCAVLPPLRNLTGGSIKLDGRRSPTPLSTKLRRSCPTMMQIGVPGPQASLNPRMTVAGSLASARMEHSVRMDAKAQLDRIYELMECRGGLETAKFRQTFATRMNSRAAAPKSPPPPRAPPKKKRIGIWPRALLRSIPKFIVCDEPHRGDSTCRIQAQVGTCLEEFAGPGPLACTYPSSRTTFRWCAIFADRCGKSMYLGKVVERRPATVSTRNSVCPPNTKALLSAVRNPTGQP